MGALGLRETMTVVVYEQAGVFSAPRAVWMLRTFGVRVVHLLDGGLQAWTPFAQRADAAASLWYGRLEILL